MRVLLLSYSNQLKIRLLLHLVMIIILCTHILYGNNVVQLQILIAP